MTEMNGGNTDCRSTSIQYLVSGLFIERVPTPILNIKSEYLCNMILYGASQQVLIAIF